VLGVRQTQRQSWTRPNAQAEACRQLTAARWHLDAGDAFDQVLDVSAGEDERGRVRHLR